MAKIPVSYQPNKIKKPTYTDWIDEEGKFCTTTNPAGSDTPPASGLNLLDAFDVDWSAYTIDDLLASANAIISKLNEHLKQIDGEISSWLFEGEPTTTNKPANEWTGTDENGATFDYRQRHEGDTYTNIENAILLDSSMWEQGGIVGNTDASASGADQASEYFVRTKYINVKGCSQLLRLGSDYYYTIFYYDSNKTCLKVDSVTAKDLTITTYLQILKTVSNKNVAYFRLRLGYQNGVAQNLKFNVGNAVDAKAMINPTAGQSWRWCPGNGEGDTTNTGWHWHKIADSDAVKALTIANGVREDFDNLEIGGVNLLPNTRTGVGFTFQPLATGCSGEFDSTNKWFKFTCPQNAITSSLTDTILLKSPTVLLTPGTYTVSCLYRCTLPLNRMQVLCLPVTSEGSYDMNTLSFAFEVKSSSPVTYFQKYSATFNISEDLRDVYGWIIRIDLDHRGSHGNSQELYIKDIKLEKGHKATDWTPTLSEITSGYLPLIGGTMQGNINFKNEFNTIYGDDNNLHLNAHTAINLDALETNINNIFPQISTANIGSSSNAFNGIYANSFIKPGSNDNYVLLAGGGTKALSEFTTDLSGYLPLSGGTMTGAIDFEWNGSDIHNMLTWRKLGILLLDDTNWSKLYLGTAAKLPLTVHELTTNGNILPSTSAPPIGMVSAIIPGEPSPTYISLGSDNKYFDKVYAREFKGLADNALKLYAYGTGISSRFTPTPINVGGSSTPVYFSNGVPVACNSIPTSDTVASWGYVTTSGITQLKIGDGLQGKDNKDADITEITTSGTISLKTASDSDIGGIKLGYSENGKNYPVEISTDKKAYVNVPWTNTDSKVTQSRSTSNGAYPLLCKYDTKPGEPTTNSVNFVSGVTVNPSTGAVNATAFYETSDIRKKEIKSDLSLDKCYDLIDKCQTVIYSLKDQTKELVGMIAQEIEEFFPEVVATDEEGFKSLAYDRLVVICFKVLKDVIKRLEKLETK